MVAHVHIPPLSPPSPLPPKDPGAPGCVPQSGTALTLETADSKVLTPASPSLGSTDPDTSPLLCYPDSQEIEEDQLHRILAINALTRDRIIRKEPLITPEARETVALPYAEQLTLPTTEVTHESDSAKKMAQILKSVNVSASLDALKGFSLTLCTALEESLSKYKDMDVYQVTYLSNGTDRTDSTYIDIMVHKVKVQAIIDSGAPGNIISSQLVKKLKLAPDLDYQEVFGTAGPLTTKAMGAYLSLPLQFEKLIVTAPAIVLDNHSYDILIGTGFMTRYGTITNHDDNTFKILGQTIPMYYNGAKVTDLPKKKLHFINMEYADGDIPVAYTLRHRKLRMLPPVN
ncbi:DNA damage-inducible protein 1 [Entomophthora muscae]|uniref:DNA damage-inducible protein 1 n=1 Tax=Entomophthora muscae TaxID=34485 RepID=A0ACC2UJG3_9FUNG|nr:DNA damage-inducible protein 1 [Entomophthora muscae]